MINLKLISQLGGEFASDFLRSEAQSLKLRLTITITTMNLNRWSWRLKTDWLNYKLTMRGRLLDLSRSLVGYNMIVRFADNSYGNPQMESDQSIKILPINCHYVEQ